MGTRSGKQYTKGIEDSREVWLAGERVANVATHPALEGSVRSIANLFDRQLDPAHEAALTYEEPGTGERCPIAYRPPSDPADLVARRHAFKSQADATYGLMGRSPDFVATAVTAFATAADYFGQVEPDFAHHIRRYYEYCRSQDLFLAHATINPSTDRSKTSSEGENVHTHLRVSGRSSEGLRVSGAKLISTLAPIADELVIFPLPGYREGDEEFTAAFAVPIATEGLRLVCREPFGGAHGRDPFDHPLAGFDEIDATCVFDNVFVPWERVFFYGDVSLANRLYDATTARHHTGHHGITRGVAKAELLVGVAVALAESANAARFLHVQEMLGELIGYLELAKGIVLQAEADATDSAWGTLTPSMRAIQAARYHFPRMYARMVEVVQLIGAGGLLSTPTSADLAGGPEQLEPLFRAADGSSGRDRVAMLKLAWDITGDGIGQRQLQYERYHSGDPVRLAAQEYLHFDLAPLRALVSGILRPATRGGEPA
ncbi:MAG TPA: 4-hydroxyphenylacetate 3-hydroxylase N-terminal domain-containing protein [Actinopolymorphaceae bacterium]